MTFVHIIEIIMYRIITMALTTLRDVRRITKIKQILENNDASTEFINTALSVCETLHTDYEMNFIYITHVFEAFLQIHHAFRFVKWETSKDTLKYDPHFMLVWSRLLKKSKPLQKKTSVTTLVITCLYLTYSLHGIETSYPLKPFLEYVESADVIYNLAINVIKDHFSMAILQA